MSQPAEKDAPACDCESMGGRFGSHRPECPWQIAFEAQLAAEKDAGTCRHCGKRVLPPAEGDAAEPDRCTSRSEDGRRCHGDTGHPGTHWAAASRVWSDTETLVRPVPPGEATS